MRVLVWDIETETRAPEITDSGVSAIAIYDSQTGRTHLYGRSNIQAAVEHLNFADLLVGFNSIDFDTVIVEEVSGEEITAPQYDLLKQIWASLPETSSHPKGWKLRQVCPRTIGLEKEHPDASTEELVSQGRWAELFDYCISDVHLTTELYNFIVSEGYVVGPDGEELRLMNPPPEEAYA